MGMNTFFHLNCAYYDLAEGPRGVVYLSQAFTVGILCCFSSLRVTGYLASYDYGSAIAENRELTAKFCTPQHRSSTRVRLVTETSCSCMATPARSTRLLFASRECHTCRPGAPAFPMLRSTVSQLHPCRSFVIRSSICYIYSPGSVGGKKRLVSSQVETTYRLKCPV